MATRPSRTGKSVTSAALCRSNRRMPRNLGPTQRRRTAEDLRQHHRRRSSGCSNWNHTRQTRWVDLPRGRMAVHGGRIQVASKMGHTRNRALGSWTSTSDLQGLWAGSRERKQTPNSNLGEMSNSSADVQPCSNIEDPVGFCFQYGLVSSGEIDAPEPLRWSSLDGHRRDTRKRIRLQHREAAEAYFPLR